MDLSNKQIHVARMNSFMVPGDVVVLVEVFEHIDDDTRRLDSVYELKIAGAFQDPMSTELLTAIAARLEAL